MEPNECGFVAHFVGKAGIGGLAVVGARSQRLGVLLGEIALQSKSCVGGSVTAVFRWLALARRQ